MDPSTGGERENLINRVMAASTFDQIQEARQALAEWIQSHPGDTGMGELEEHLRNTEKTLTPQTPQATAYLTTEPRQPS